MTWGCQAGVEPANLTTDMKHYKITGTESYESIKLEIDAHAKWYYVARNSTERPRNRCRRWTLRACCTSWPGRSD